jgi:membrane-associated phospholipid phosphatase
MNAFDYVILSKITSFEGRYPSVDRILFSAMNGLLTAGPIVAMFWWAWFKKGENIEQNQAARESVVSAMLASFLALFVIRFADLVLPFRIRPLADPTVQFHFPKEPGIRFEDWSSFPSDHAILFLTLTTCVFSFSRLLGWIALMDSFFLVLLPRIYLGIHYPTDVLAGSAIGVGIGLLANQKDIKTFAAGIVFPLLKKYPGPFYAGFFLFMHELTNMFMDGANLASVIIRHLRAFLHHH